MSDAGGAGDPKEKLNKRWTDRSRCKPVDKITRQAPAIQRGKGKEDDLETLGVVIWNQTSKKLVTPGDSWRD